MNATSRASSSRRSRSQSSPVVSATTVSEVGPASSTPDSSNVSRTAAHTSARASWVEVPSSRPHSPADGPAQPIAASASLGSTPPPGNTQNPPAKAIAATRRSR